LCKFFQSGTCTRGAKCSFKHPAPVLASEGGVGRWLSGDWECTSCGAHNFAKNDRCWKKECGEKKPGEGGKGAGKGKAGATVRR
jgi:hypothetical protein